MLPLPPVLLDPAFRVSTRLGRDHYVRVLSSDYSVHPRAIGRRVDVRADLTEVRVTCADELVARHRRSLVPHQVVCTSRTAIDPARRPDQRGGRRSVWPAPAVFNQRRNCFLDRHPSVHLGDSSDVKATEYFRLAAGSSSRAVTSELSVEKPNVCRYCNAVARADGSRPGIARTDWTGTRPGA